MATISGTNNSYIDEIIGFSIIIIIFILFRPILFSNFEVWGFVSLILIGMVLGAVLSSIIANILHLEDFSLEIKEDIETLDLSKKSLISLNLEELPKLEKLKVLNLENNRLDKIDFAPFRGHPSLEILDFSSNNLEVVDLTILKTCKKLRRIDLRHNAIEAIEASNLLQMEVFQDLLVDDSTKLTIQGLEINLEQFQEMKEKNNIDLDKILIDLEDQKHENLQGFSNYKDRDQAIVLGFQSKYINNLFNSNGYTSIDQFDKSMNNSLEHANKFILDSKVPIEELGDYIENYSKLFKNFSRDYNLINSSLEYARNEGITAFTPTPQIEELISSLSAFMELFVNVDKTLLSVIQSINSEKLSEINHYYNQISIKNLESELFSSNSPDKFFKTESQYETVIEQFKTYLNILNNLSNYQNSLESKLKENSFQTNQDLIEILFEIQASNKKTEVSILELTKNIKLLIEKKKKFFKPWDIVFNVLESTRENIPVNLSRIAELSELSNDRTEELVKLILLQYTHIGSYLEYEQVYIRGSDISKSIPETADNLSSSENPKKSSVMQGLQKCPNCDQFQSILIRKCSDCGFAMDYCNICKRGFLETDVLTSCPSCQNNFHKFHLLEYIKTSGKCPVCKENLDENHFKL